MRFKEINPFWDLVDPLTIDQAAALIAGFDPHSVHASGEYFKDTETGLTDSEDITLVQTAFSALANAIDAGKLTATVRHDAEPRYIAGLDMLEERAHWGNEDVIHAVVPKGFNWDTEEYTYSKESYVITPTPNWGKTTIWRDDLRTWLAARGFCGGYFFPGSTDAPDYLDPNNPRYAPKLAAAVRAWQAVDNLNGKTPKQAIIKWLREHATEFSLSDDEGKLNENGIEEVAKVANWQPGGGSPKTPGE